MKKIRSCPFGYRMENGTYTVVPKERHLIEQIFTRYLDGASLQQLSIMAEETGLKFRENASSWNKNMVSRILDNSRYWDGEQYPPIVEREIATKVADLKQSKASPRSQTPFIQKRMTCPYCGSRLKRNGKSLIGLFGTANAANNVLALSLMIRCFKSLQKGFLLFA